MNMPEFTAGSQSLTGRHFSIRLPWGADRTRRCHRYGVYLPRGVW